MKVATIARAAALSILCLAQSAWAGGFVTLPTSDPLRVDGAALNADDPFYLGLGIGALPPTFVELAARITTVMDIDSGLELGALHDRVFRDSDNKLVFGARLELTLDDSGFNPFEVNDIMRAGFRGLAVATAWWDASGNDYRMKSAARTAQGLVRLPSGFAPDSFDADVVDVRTDTSGPEDAPLSGWYFIKTDATDYQLLAQAVNVYSGNEDISASVTDRWIAGFAPVPVPEPSEYAMFLIGVGMVGFAARRRAKRA